jgi:hypothetical protein
MESQPATFTPADLQRFERDGYVVVRQAFPRTEPRPARPLHADQAAVPHPRGPHAPPQLPGLTLITSMIRKGCGVVKPF